ncbi:sugar kinase [Comamonas thiooxydans]|uniref:hypothetical protein n=1 Tax=Comamonas thiooxydans TaxID=363952 RepID=UPI000620FF34|nr:hypothetical protein [Comamonas thiooxydans]KKI12392.1 sugar kinase [Comamonas thiooxydans]
MTMQSPELLLKSLNNALRRLRGACTVLGNEELDDKLLDAMRRLLLAEILGDTWILAMGGSQGAGKTTLMASIYDLRGDGHRWLQGNEGRGEKMPVLIQEIDGLAHPQGYVRRLVKVEDHSSQSFKLEDVIVDVDEFQRAVCDPDAEDLLPVLCVPRRYFKRDKQAWLLLPGYEKQDRSNRSWQELMRQAMIGAGGCIIVTDETRMANQQQLEIVKDMLQNELRNCKPYIVISKTEAHRHNEKRLTELRASAQSTFQVDAELAAKQIILSGTDDPSYMAEWMPLLISSIDDLNFTGQSNRHLQMGHLSAIVGKDLSRVLNDIRSKSRLYFSSDRSGAGEGAQVLEDVLEKFDDAVESMREKHHKAVESIANDAFVSAAAAMNKTLAEDHEGFRNWVANAFNTTSETKVQMQALVSKSWQKAAPTYFSSYSNALARLTSARLGRLSEEGNPEDSPEVPLLAQPQKLIQLAYEYPSGQPVRYARLNQEVVSDIRILLGNSSHEEERVHQDASKQLGISVTLLPAITLEYSRLAFGMPEVCGINRDYSEPVGGNGANHVADGVQSLQTGVALGKTAIKSFAAVLAVDVVSDGDSDILGALTAPSPPVDGGVPTFPVGVASMHPAAIAVTAVVAGAYVTSVAVTRLRTFEREASAQAHNMLASVRDHHVEHMKTHFNNSMSVVRERVKEKIRTRYRMDETLMEKDRLAAAIADVLSITSDLRYQLDASPTGLQPFLAHDPV